MKTFRQFISEVKTPKPDALETINRNTERKVPGLKFLATNNQLGDIELTTINVPKEKQNQGHGSWALKNMTSYADKQKKRVVLTPEAEPRKKGSLERFYKKFNFKKNKGRNRDFRTSHTRIREPNQ